MTGTKVIKLNLEGQDGIGRLPGLRDSVVPEAIRLFAENFNLTSDTSRYYGWALENTKKLDVSSSEVQSILDSLEKTFGDDHTYSWFMGLYMTALMRNSSRKKFRLAAKVPLHFLGYHMEEDKDVTVDGDVGDWVGSNMAAGRITVNGRAGDSLGALMEGGSIHVRGDAGMDVGRGARSGTIDVDGVIGGVAHDVRGAKVRQKGRRV
ncbi:MAG: hypothetical protein V1921_06325 [Candidatus Altiarchaeota archaeon]